MTALLLLVGVVCLLGGILLGWVARELLEADPWDRLAETDRRRHA